MNALNIIDIIVAILMVIGTGFSLGIVAYGNGLRDGAIFMARYNRNVLTPLAQKVNIGIGAGCLALFAVIDMNVSFVTAAICWFCTYAYLAYGIYLDRA
jgi:hypothetical protein